MQKKKKEIVYERLRRRRGLRLRDRLNRLGPKGTTFPPVPRLRGGLRYLRGDPPRYLK